MISARWQVASLEHVTARRAAVLDFLAHQEKAIPDDPYARCLREGASDEPQPRHASATSAAAVLTLCDPERLNPLSPG